MNTQHLEYIIEIYKSGSLNKAAKNCFISQSYLSKIIKSFEDELGCKLIRSSNQGVSFTQAGLLFLKSSEIIVQECGNIYKIPMALEQNQSLCVACSPSSVLVQSFIDFEKKTRIPGVHDTLIEGGIRLIFKNLTAHYSEIGVAVMFSRKVEKYRLFCEGYNLEMDTLIDGVPNMVAMSAKHPLAAREQVCLADLRQYPFVVDANVDYDDTLAVLNMKDTQELLFVSGRGCVFDALRSGQYITAMISVPAEDARRHHLVCRPIGDLEEKMSILLLKAKSHILSHREAEFVDFLRKRLENYCREDA